MPRVHLLLVSCIMPLILTSTKAQEKKASTDPEVLTKNLKEAQSVRCETLDKLIEQLLPRDSIGRDPGHILLDAFRKSCEAGLDRDKGDAAKEAEHVKKWVERTTQIAKARAEAVETGRRMEEDAMQARAARFEAEIAEIVHRTRNQPNDADRKRIQDARKARYEELKKLSDSLFGELKKHIRPHPDLTRYLRECCLAGVDMDRGDADKEAAHYRRWIEAATEIAKIETDVRADVLDAEVGLLEARTRKDLSLANQLAEAKTKRRKAIGERIESVTKFLESMNVRVEVGKSTALELPKYQILLADLRLELDAGDRAKVETHLRKRVEVMAEDERICKLLADSGTRAEQDLLAKRADRLEAEIALLKHRLAKK